MTEKDYSLLRPFDLEAAKRGDAIMQEYAPAFIATLAAISKDGRTVFAEFRDGSANAWLTYAVSMAPLCWVEGKPVYKGDVLYWKAQRTSPCIAEKIMDGGWLAFRASDNEPCGLVHPDGLTWTPPKVIEVEEPADSGVTMDRLRAPVIEEAGQ